jgi:hypothetical protein
MHGGDMLPGTHNIQPEEIAVRDWADLRRAIARLRRKYPLIARSPSFLEHDRATFKITFPVIYELVFRGQTREYIDPRSGKPLLLPNAFRPGVRPAWVHRGPPGLWGELPAFVFNEELAPPPFEALTEDDLAQIEAYHEALLNYCLHVMGITGTEQFKERLETWEPSGGLEDILNSVALRSIVKREHKCVLWGGPTPVPPLNALLRDVTRFHDLQPVWAGTFSDDEMVQDFQHRYVREFLRVNVQFQPVVMAILQHYGLPTKALDVTFDPLVALWFALNVAKREGERLRFEAAQDAGYVYAMWVPVTYDWHGDGGKYYRWARSQGYGVEKLTSPTEPAIMVDLSSSMTMIGRDRHTRAIRQRAALLTALVLRPDWSPNAYAEYLVARLTVSPKLVRQLQTQKGHEKYRSEHLIHAPAEDRLLGALIESGVRGLELPG